MPCLGCQPPLSAPCCLPLPTFLGGLCICFCLAGHAPAADPAATPDPAPLYAAQIRPLLKKYCLDCHSTKEKKGELDLERFALAADLRGDLDAWRKVVEMLDDGQMPPEDELQPSAAERAQLAGWTRSFIDAEIRARAGDPGRVVVRRLSNAEYNYTIRDLTGVDLQPAREFPADGAAGEGFANAADALVMSPTLLAKYLAAAKGVAAHLVLLPEGLRFSPAVTRRDWTNEVLGELGRTYREVYTGPSDGMLEFRPYLATVIRHRAALRAGQMTFEQAAEGARLNAKYLAALWGVLNDTEPSIALDGVRAAWRAADPEHPNEEAEALAPRIRAWQSTLWKFNRIGSYMSDVWQEPALPKLVPSHTAKLHVQPPPDASVVKLYLVTRSLASGPDAQNATTPGAVWKNPRIEGGNKPSLPLEEANQNYAWKTLIVNHPASVTEIQLPADVLRDRDFVVDCGLTDEPGQLVQFEVLSARPDRNLRPAEGQPCVGSADLLALPPEQLAPQYDALRRVFPIFLFHGKIVPDDEIICLRMYFREDEPLARLFLSPAQADGLDRLWEQLIYVSQEPLVEYKNYETFMGFVSQDGPADFARVEKRTREPVRLRAEQFQQQLAATWPKHVAALVDFASRAYRRPLAEAEITQLGKLFQKLQAKGLTDDEAFRTMLAGVLVSPAFLYRSEQPAPGSESRPVSNWELASRLSYFLWASMPDDELRQVAASGKLSEPAVLAAQVQRMLKDPKMRGLAVEFGTQWLQVRDLRENREKNEKLFPEFNDQVRQALFEEAVLFFQDLFQHDRSLLGIVDADYTFVDERLAGYYGIPNVSGAQWRRVEGVKQQGRGGVLALGSVLAKQSAASRTSPVLRGNWVVDTLLGEKTPKPPANVPRLPEEESETGDLTVRQLVEKHAHVAECAVCHQRIDPFGFALEKYDAIGRLRDKDSAGRAIATDAQLKDGTRLDGIDGLRQYLLSQRRDQVVRQFCKKLLGYALGRSVVLSDEPLLDAMLVDLKANDFRFSIAVLAIVNSPQFLNHRGLEATKEQ